MKTMIALVFGLLTIGLVLSDSPHNKDIYGGKRDDDNGGKFIQYGSNAGPINHYVIASNSQPTNSKYELNYTPNTNYRNSHVESVPYPGVYNFPSKAGPVQYAVTSHQPVSYHQPVQMIVTSYQPSSAHYNKGGNGLTYHGSPSGHHVAHASVAPQPPQQKYTPAQYNTIVPLHVHVPHHSQRHQQQPSALVPIAVPAQHLQRQSAVSHAIPIYPTAQQAYFSSLSGPLQQHQEQQQAATLQVTTAPLSVPTHQYVTAQQFQQQAHQQPQYSYSVQPSVQISAAKQIVAPIQATQQYKPENYGTGQYTNDGGLSSSYVSLVRQYTTAPGKAVGPVQHVFYPTPSTPVYSTVKPHVMVAVQPTGQGSHFDYSNVGAATLQYNTQLYHQPTSGKAAKYA